MKFLLLFPMIFCAIIGFSQSICHLPLSNTLERKVFKQISDSVDVDLFELYSAFEFKESGYYLHKGMVDAFVSDLSQQLENKSLKKKVKTIYKKTHERFLKKYDEKAFFGDIFSSGNYNCVTASALYSIILTKMNIPFVVKETPVHVYLIADPEGNQILMESTAPRNGTFYIDENYKRDFVKHLKDNKLISDLEFQQKSTQQLFQEHYDENKTINAVQLAALQYYNRGVFGFEDKKISYAVENFQKAYTIYPSPTIHYTLTVAMHNLMNEQLVNKKFDGKTLANYLNYSKENMEASSVALDYINYVANEWVINRPAINSFRQFFNEYRNYVDSIAEDEEIRHQYYQMMGRYFGIKKDYFPSLQYLDSAYQINPESLTNQELLQIIVSSYVCRDRNNKQEIDSLNKYTEAYPFLLDTESIQEYYTYCYMKVINNYSRQNNNAAALLYLSDFEKLIEKNEDFKVHSKYIEMGFENLVVSYLSQGNFKKAKECVNRAVELSNDSEELVELQNKMTKIIKDYNSYSKTQSESVVVNPPKYEIKPHFKDLMDKLFPGKWEAYEREENGKKVEINSENNLVIESSYDKSLTYTVGKKQKKGRWAVRSSRRLLYLVSANDENDYLLYSVVQLDDKTMELKLYKNRKPQNIIIRLRKVS